MDIEQIVEQEKQAEEAQEAIEAEKMAATAAAQTEGTAVTGGAMSGIANAGPSGVDGLLDREANNYQEKAEAEEEQRKKET